MYLRFLHQLSEERSARTLFAAIALAVAIAICPAVAQAQAAPSSPAPAPSATATNANAGNPSQTNPNGGPPVVPVQPVRGPAALSHLPIIDLVTTYTQQAVGDQSQIHAYDPVDVGGTVRLPVTRNFSLFFDRLTGGTLNQALEIQRINGAVIKPGDTRDIILQYHGTVNFNKYISLDLGTSFRHRIYANDGSGVSNRPFPTTISSTEHHYAFAGVNIATRPIRGLANTVFIFGDTVEAQNVDHHVGILCTAALVTAKKNSCTAAGTAGVLDENPNQNRYYETTQSVTALIPVDAKHGATVSLNERWGTLNLYENAPFPYRYSTALTEVFSKRINSFLTVALRHQDFHQLLQGAPFPSPGVIHVAAYDLIGTIHLDFAHLFR